MGKGEGDVVKDKEIEYFKMVRVQWWILVKKGSNLDERHLYENCWNGTWKCNFKNLEQWFDISTILFFFPTRKNKTNTSQIIISTTNVSRLKVNSDVVNVLNNL
jgi:hypothetical protein